jgi:hypothetical protein
MRKLSFQNISNQLVDKLKEAIERKRSFGIPANKYIPGMTYDAIYFHVKDGIFTYRDKALPDGLVKQMIGNKIIEFERAVFISQKLHQIRYVLTNP